MMNATSKARLLARYEVGWWIWHGRKDFGKATEFMAKEYRLQFDMPYSMAMRAVGYRIKAAKMHDRAEELDRRGRTKDGLVYWKRAEKLLERHFALVVNTKPDQEISQPTKTSLRHK
jgi:hypothetical protein